MNRSLFLPTGKTLLLRHRPPSSLSPVHDDPVRIPPVCSNARGALYTRYTPNDWWDFHHHQVASAQRMLLRSRTLNRDNDCLVRDIEVRTRRNQEISTKELANVQLDFRLWISKLEELRQQFVDTIEKLDLRRRQMESYLSKLEAELKLAQENLYDREKRHQCDLVHDDLQCELIRLIDLLTDGQRTLKNDFEQIGEHSRCSRDLLREINLEANQKLHALSHQTAALHSTHTLPCYSNPEDLQQLVPNEHCHTDGVTYIRWCKRMQGLAEQADGILQGSRDLLLSNRHLPAFETTIVHQWQRVDDALERHVQDLHCIRDQLHDQLDDVHENVLNTAKSIEFLRKSIEDQSAYANVIQCRVALLSTRTPSENITDVEYPKLLEELNDLQCSMARLRRGMSQEEGILQHLIRLKTTLQEDLATKNNSLFIHREKISGQRRTNKKIVTHGLNAV